MVFVSFFGLLPEPRGVHRALRVEAVPGASIDSYELN
jgi:hypothetical protein